MSATKFSRIEEIGRNHSNNNTNDNKINISNRNITIVNDDIHY
jgi:hypothetical protein